ncbi:site-specific DNA-methyltransferase [Bifidobacterium catulorum]|uniref:Site-specific DNA-methyltransferase n=1 Tax=Bifidobacterium catulorum TaxID=1630173 RepID=A0A2U2MSL6_9BIFI|nr:site-specific DNA-methyltransferase [Bifidobacterium catulorum]PWG59846.1 site-specific DNA-methyltransferase [Bifidobacterium catulorum]
MSKEPTKLPLESADLVKENIGKLEALFPEIMEDRKIDFDKLREILGGEVDDSPERYAFIWPGKRDAIRQSQTSSTATLRPQKDKSVDWDTTKNLYIEGDNLEVLKLLQRSYHGKVKMIYIDPPYNTGNDFVYNDKFGDPIENYKRQTGQESKANPETDGRFHSNWCSMIYPRLRLARELLSDDGVIFVSIDDHEVVNGRLVLNELFGERNFIVQIIWKKRSTPPNDQVIGAAHEYALVYAKNMDAVRLNLRERSKEQLAKYKNPDHHPKGPWTAGDLSANVKGGRYVASLNYPITNPNTGEQHFPPNNGNWRYSRDTVNKMLANNEIYFGADGMGRPKVKRFLSEVKQGVTYTSIWDFVPFNTQGSAEMSEYMGNLTIFDNPKPVDYIKEMVKLGAQQDSLILDFFSGSATTAHAVMKLNADDGGHRRFIMVQLPEQCDVQSEAAKAGYHTICEIGEERIRRAGQKIKTEVDESNKQLELGVEPKPVPDIGFRVLSLDSSNFEQIEQQAGTFDLRDNTVKAGRSVDDLVFEVMLKWGLDLSLPIEPLVLDGYQCWSVAKGELICCMDKGLTVPVLEAIAGMEDRPRRVLLRDNVIDDTLKLNAEAIFGRASADGDEIELRTV